MDTSLLLAFQVFSEFEELCIIDRVKDSSPILYPWKWQQTPPHTHTHYCKAAYSKCP